MLLFSSSVRRQVSLKTSRDILSAGVPDQFLNALFQRCGLKQSELFITSSVKCRPPHDPNLGSAMKQDFEKLRRKIRRI